MAIYYLLNERLVDELMSNGTAPKEISINNFPRPFLSHDKKFIKDYDTLVKSFLVQIMDLCVKRVNEQIHSFRLKINKNKTNYLITIFKTWKKN